MVLASKDEGRPLLPPEVLLYFRDFLARRGLKGTAARLASISPEFYNLFLPILDYENLVLDERTAQGICNVFVKGEQGTTPQTELTRDIAKFVGCGRNCFLHNIGKPRPLEWSDRKANLLKQCRYLTLKDRAALTALVDAHEYLESRDYLFPNVTHLSLSGELLWDLALKWQDHRTHDQTVEDLDLLKRILRPYHLCVTFYRPNIDFVLSPLPVGLPVRTATPEEDEEAVNGYISSQGGISRLVDELSQAWLLDSLTCHNITSQPIPVTFLPLHRVIFRRIAGPLPDMLIPAFSIDRVEEIADAACLTGPPDESKFEFIGIENIEVYSDTAPVSSDSDVEIKGPGTPEESHNRDLALRPLIPEERSNDIISRIWEQISQPEIRGVAESSVSFSSIKGADACVCCGTL